MGMDNRKKRKSQAAGEEKLLTTSQAAKLLSVSPDTVLKWVKSGKVRSRRTLGGHFRICLDDLKVPDAEREERAETAPRPGFQYCWEYLTVNGELRRECTECITYRSRARRCYELRKLPEGIGCLGLCEASCEDCQYYKLVKGKCHNILIVSDDEAILKNPEDRGGSGDLSIKFAENEYECSFLVQSFRPDYIIIDCNLGKKRISDLCRNAYRDPRIPLPRIVLSSKVRKSNDYCDREIFGWIRKPFGVDQILECIQCVS